MEIGALLLGAVIVGVTLYLVAEPFIFAEPGQPRGQVSKAKEETLEQKKEALFSALGEIEFDYRMGKLSDEDYKELQAVYRPQAVALLHQEDKAPVPAREKGGKIALTQPRKDLTDIEREIEAEVAAEVRRLKQQSSRGKKS
ncbi:MAG: hypothetical protein ACOY9Y_05960 [Bacillota bacterium]